MLHMNLRARAHPVALPQDGGTVFSTVALAKVQGPEHRLQLLLKSLWASLFLSLCSGCGGSGGGSGDAPATPTRSGAPVVASLQVGTPVSSTVGGGMLDGPVSPGDSRVVEIRLANTAPYARMRVWLQVNAAGADIDHYDWEIPDWSGAAARGALAQYDSAIDIDPVSGRYVVRTSENRIRYDSATFAELRQISGSSTQTVVATAWTSEGQFASAYFTLALTQPVGGWWSVDVNQNGMSDVWEKAYSVAGADPAADADSDGLNNFEESVAGTDPNDPQSVFRVEASESAPEGYLVRWNSIAGKLYQIETTTSLGGGGWEPAGTVVHGTGDEVLAFIPPTDPPFLAVRLKLSVDNPAVLAGRPFLEDVDTDRDGTADIDEWAAGTDPFDGNSRLQIDSVGLGKAVILRWPSVKGKRYQVESTTSLANGPWISRSGLIQGTGSDITAAIEAGAGSGYFRVGVTDSDSDADAVTDWEESFLGFDMNPVGYRKEHPTDMNSIVALLNASNVVEVEAGAAVANATTGSPGSFRVTRSGSINAITINYTVSGDAIADLHYKGLSGSVTLAPGVDTMEIPVIPMSEGGLNPARSVVLTLGDGAGYKVGSNSIAQVNVLREVPLSVADFGAIGDGLTDDTLAIQAAITALEASSNCNTLHFPSGIYRLNTPTFGVSPYGTFYKLLTIGLSDLAGRDLLITGEPGAELFSAVSALRARIFVVHASFRSLCFRGLTWRKTAEPLPGKSTEADGVSLVRFDMRRVEAVDFLNCTFNNCHAAVFTYSAGFDARGRLAHFGFERCTVLNPFGANARDSAAWGGGQQMVLNPWIGQAVYSSCVFDGGGDGVDDPERNPGAKRKDGCHFGSPLTLVFTNNLVRNMDVEAVYQINDPSMGITLGSFTVPPGDGASTASVIVDKPWSTYRPGQTLNFRIPAGPSSLGGNVQLTAVSFDATNRVLTVKNEGQTAGAAGSTVLASAWIYSQDYDPTHATIQGNVIDSDSDRVGLLGVGSNSKAVIRDNFITGYRSGVYLYANVRNPLNPPTPGTRVESNVVLTPEPVSGSSITYGVQTYGPGDFIAHNFIVTPASTRFVGVAMRGQDSWAEANTILPIQVVRHGYGDVDRSVGIGVGPGSTGTTSVANHSYGLDVGNGPIGAYQNVPRQVISHVSTNDVLAIDPLGLTPDSLP